MTAEIVPPLILVRAPFALMPVLKGLPCARWAADARAWTYPATPNSARAIVKSLPDLAPHLGALLSPEVIEVVEAIPGIRTRLWEHQRRAVAFAAPLPAAMLALEVGCGKSLAALALAELWRARRVLVLSPLSVVGVWPREVARHCLAPWAIARLDGGSVAKKRAEAERALGASGRSMVVINHESAWREPFALLALATPWDLVIVDEAHRSKAPGGRFSRFLSALGRRVPRRLALTGTPLPHSPLDAYGQYRYLDPTIYGTSYALFRARYAVMGGYQQHQVVGFQNLADFEERFASIAIRVRKADALDLPPEVEEERRCTLEPSAQRIYRSLEKDFYAAVGAGEVTAANALVKLLRLEQLAGGVLPLDGGGSEVVSRAKAMLLLDTLEDIAEPVVVFARFRADLTAVREVTEKLGRRYGEVSGERKDLTKDAHMPENVDVLGVQIQAGGVGIDLTRAATAIYYSHGWSLGDILQSRGRLHRPGQMRRVTYIHLIAEGTVDEAAMAALLAREEMVESILRRVGRG